MKKLLLLLALMGMVVVGCSKEEVDNGNDNDNNNTEQPNEKEEGNEDDMPDDIFFGLDKESVVISPDGGSVEVVVYSNYKWEISGTSDWCTPSVINGSANEDGQKIAFSADLTYDDREATFWFRCADEKIKFVVSQKLKAVVIPDANNSFNISAEGGIAILNYQTSVACEVIIPEEAQDWITIAPATRGLVSESISLDVAENTTYDSRSAVVKIVAKDNPELVVEYTINQEQNDSILVDENNTFNVPNTGGEVVIKYQTNVACEVVIPEDAQDWITIAPATRGLVAYNTTLNVTANYSGKQRNSVVKVISLEHNELFAEFTISQDPRYCLFYTSSNGKIVEPYDNSSFDATILSNTYEDGVGVIEFDAPITTIGYAAFGNCRNLTSVTIPESVTTIGESAFTYCISLQEFNGKFASEDGRCLIIEGVLSSFAPAGLTEYSIPDNVTSIGNNAFQSCSSLASVIIPDSVTSIGNYSFSNCSSITSIAIGNSVTTIGYLAFESCSSLTSITIPNSVTSIGFDVFENCSSLTSVTIGNSLTTIAPRAFSNCSSLVSVDIPNGVTTIEHSAFAYCSSLTSVIIPDSVTAVGDWAFFYCSSLKSITVGNSVTTIGYSTFSNCSSLASVTIGDSVTTIGTWAFSNCSGLTSVIIPDNVTTIADRAFIDCSSLTSITIGNSVTSIEYSAFENCYCLTNVYCKPTTPPAGNNSMFDNNATGRKIYVPMQSVSNYRSAEYWKDYADAIVGYDF